MKIINELITEHGSAIILKERLEQVREQFSELQKKMDALSSENSHLKGVLEKRETEIKQLRNELSIIKRQNTNQGPKIHYDIYNDDDSLDAER